MGGGAGFEKSGEGGGMVHLLKASQRCSKTLIGKRSVLTIPLTMGIIIYDIKGNHGSPIITLFQPDAVLSTIGISLNS